MFCKYCGSKISEDAIFCEKCGKRLVSEDINNTKSSVAEENNISMIDNSESTETHNKTDMPVQTKRKVNFHFMKLLLVASMILCIVQGIITAKSFVDLSNYQNIAAGMHFTPSASRQQENLYGRSPADIGRKQAVDTAWDRVYFAQAAVKRNCILLTIFLAFFVVILITYNRSKRKV